MLGFSEAVAKDLVGLTENILRLFEAGVSEWLGSGQQGQLMYYENLAAWYGSPDDVRPHGGKVVRVVEDGLSLRIELGWWP